MYNIRTRQGRIVLCAWCDLDKAKQWLKHYKSYAAQQYYQGRGKHHDLGWHIVQRTSHGIIRVEVELR